MGDALGAFELDAEQQLAFPVERPGVAALEIFLRRDPPDRSGGRFGAAAARPDAEPSAARLSTASCIRSTGDGKAGSTPADWCG